MLDADAEGNLYSERMDKEMARSESITFLRKKAANKRWNQQDNAHAYAKGHARMHKQTPMQSESESESCSDSESKAKPLTTLPLNDSSEYAIYENQVSEWKSLYPAVDVAQSLRNMRGWCLSNPKNRKTKSGILRFINSWLAKEQNNTKGNGHAKQGYLDKLAALRSADGSYV